MRVAHIDAPEIRGPQRADGLAAKAEAGRLAPPGAHVDLYDLGPEKYGRTLAQISTAAGVNVGAELIRGGRAEPYEGGTR